MPKRPCRWPRGADPETVIFKNVRGGEAMMRSGDQGDGTYLNPVLCSDYSDPDVIAVGDDYYLTASSFNCIPGLPILHSKDLVNWSLIGHALDRLPMDCYDQPCYGRGVWGPVPCVITTVNSGSFFGTPDEGIFVTTATDPAGPWTDLHCMQPGKGLIDPCPFWGRRPFDRLRTGWSSLSRACLGRLACRCQFPADSA